MLRVKLIFTLWEIILRGVCTEHYLCHPCRTESSAVGGGSLEGGREGCFAVGRAVKYASGGKEGQEVYVMEGYQCYGE